MASNLVEKSSPNKVGDNLFVIYLATGITNPVKNLASSIPQRRILLYQDIRPFLFLQV